MWTKLLGFFYLLLGVFYFSNLNWFRKKIKKKIVKYLWRNLFVIFLSIFLGGISYLFAENPLLLKVAVIIILFFGFKWVFSLKPSLLLKIGGWLEKKPLIFFRLFATGYIILGLLLIYFI